MKQATYLITAAMLLSLTATSAHALPLAAAQPPVSQGIEIIQAQGDCFAVGQRVAAREGGQLSHVRMETKGGRTVCVGEVIVPASNGQMGRKIRFEEPL